MTHPVYQRSPRPAPAARPGRLNSAGRSEGCRGRACGARPPDRQTDETLRGRHASDIVTSRSRDPPIDGDLEPLMNQTLAAPFPDDTVPVARAVPDATDPRVRTARRVFLGALAFNAALTLLWLWSYAT